MEDHPKCLECGREIYGRAGKKFCSDACKNKHHNTENLVFRHYHGRIVSALESNHRILENLLRMKMSAIPLADIESMGFRPALITGVSKCSGKRTELSCFDIKYKMSESRIYDIRRMDSLLFK